MNDPEDGRCCTGILHAVQDRMKVESLMSEESVLMPRHNSSAPADIPQMTWSVLDCDSWLIKSSA